MSSTARVLRSRNVYRGRVLDLRIETIREPGGVEARREIVQHRGSVVVLPILSEGRVILVRQYRHAAKARLWELVAGGLKQGERPLPAARRELSEETGYCGGRFNQIFAFYPSPGFLTEKMHLFLARLLTPGPARPEADELIEVGIFAPSAIRKMIRSGKIMDGKTLVGLLWYLQHKTAMSGS